VRRAGQSSDHKWKEVLGQSLDLCDEGQFVTKNVALFTWARAIAGVYARRMNPHQSTASEETAAVLQEAANDEEVRPASNQT
jgi:hypothetical protein